jgi:hypothetical protein
MQYLLRQGRAFPLLKSPQCIVFKKNQFKLKINPFFKPKKRAYLFAAQKAQHY